MPSREALAAGLERIRSVWPSLAGTGAALEAYADVLRGFTDEELRGGITLVLQEHEAASAPKPKTLADACGRIAKHRRAEMRIQEPEAPEWYCPHCKTTRLRTQTHEFADGPVSRIVPDCRMDCPQRDAWWPRPPRGGTTAREAREHPQRGAAASPLGAVVAGLERRP